MKHLIIPLLLVGGFIALTTTQASAVIYSPLACTERAALRVPSLLLRRRGRCPAPRWSSLPGSRRRSSP